MQRSTPWKAVIKVETRGATTEINEYVYGEAGADHRGGRGDARREGGDPAYGGRRRLRDRDPALVARIEQAAKRQALFPEIVSARNMKPGIARHFMERVQKKRPGRRRS